MSTLEQLMFDPRPGRDYTPPGNEAPVHAHTGPGCVFCATRTGKQAADAAVKAITRDEAWWQAAQEWLAAQPAGARFTADTLVDSIGKPTGSPNQIGAALRKWAFTDRITAVDITTGTRRESHARVLRVWEVN